MSAPTSPPPARHNGNDGQPRPQGGIDSGLVKLAVLIFAGLLNPVAAAVGAAGYAMFAAAKVSWKWVSTAAILYGIGLVLSGQFGNATRTYMRPMGELLYNARNGGPEAIRAALPAWILDQAPLGILIGLTFASVFASWRWMRRPAWERVEQGPSPWQLLHRVKVSRDIAADKHGPKKDAITVGVSRYGKKIIQPDVEGSAHSLVLGGAGRGKTTTMLVGMRDVIRLGRGLVVLDLKGSKDVPEYLAEWAERYGRTFYHWTIHDPSTPYQGPGGSPAYYDPIGRGDPSRRKDLVVGSQKWDVEYYKTVIEHYLQIAFTVMHLVPPRDGADAITDLARMLDIRHLSNRADELDQMDHAEVLAAIEHVRTGMGEQEKSGIRNMYARLQTLIQSTAGAWLRRDPSGARNIDLRAVADEGHVVCFSLDSGNYEATSAMVAGLIVQDLKTLSSELRHTPAERGPLHVYMDEFSAAGHDNILGLLARARDARMPVTLSTQALADLRRANPDFLAQVLGIISCFMIHGTNTHDDAEVLAGLTGEHTVYRKRQDVEMRSGLGTGSGSIHDELEYRVTPDKIQDLRQGHCVYVARSPEFRLVNPVKVIRENPAKVGHRNGAPGTQAPKNPRKQLGSGRPEKDSRRTNQPAGRSGLFAGLVDKVKDRATGQEREDPDLGDDVPVLDDNWQEGMSSPHVGAPSQGRARPSRQGSNAHREQLRQSAGEDGQYYQEQRRGRGPVPRRGAGESHMGDPGQTQPIPLRAQGQQPPAQAGLLDVPDPFAAHAQAAADAHAAQGVRTDTQPDQEHVRSDRPEWLDDDPGPVQPAPTRSGTGPQTHPTRQTAPSSGGARPARQQQPTRRTRKQQAPDPAPGSVDGRPEQMPTDRADEWARSLTGTPFTADRAKNVIPNAPTEPPARGSVFAVPDMDDLSWSDSDPDRGAPMAAAPGRDRSGTPSREPAQGEVQPAPARKKTTAQASKNGTNPNGTNPKSGARNGKTRKRAQQRTTRQQPASEGQPAQQQRTPPAESIPDDDSMLFDMPVPVQARRPSKQRTRTGVSAVLDENEWSN